MAPEQLKSELERFLTPVTQGLGYELVELEWRSEPTGWVLRLYIDRPGRRVSLEDCEKVSREAEEALDRSNLIERSYHLEVSSPGLNRSLKTRDYSRYIGHRIHLEIKEPLAGSNQRVYRARIVGVADGGILVEDGSRRWEVPYDLIAKARLDPEVNI